MLNNTELEKKMEQANIRRELFLNFSDYGTYFSETFLKQLNLQGNRTTAHYRFQPSPVIELISMYSSLIDIHKDTFGDRSSYLKNSINNSVYSMLDQDLLKHNLLNLTNNNSDDFLLLSLLEFDENHAFSVIIRKVDEQFNLEIVDKAASIYEFLSEDIQRVSYDKNSNVINNMFIKITKDDSSFELLLDYLSRACGIVNIDDDRTESFLYDIQDIAEEIKPGNIISREQIQRNCIITSITTALNNALLPEKEIEAGNIWVKRAKGPFFKKKSGHLSNELINLTLLAIYKRQLHKLDYNQKDIEQLDAYFSLYSTLKELRNLSNNNAELLKKNHSKVLNKFLCKNPIKMMTVTPNHIVDSYKMTENDLNLINNDIKNFKQHNFEGLKDCIDDMELFESFLKKHFSNKQMMSINKQPSKPTYWNQINTNNKLFSHETINWLSKEKNQEEVNKIISELNMFVCDQYVSKPDIINILDKRLSTIFDQSYLNEVKENLNFKDVPRNDLLIHYAKEIDHYCKNSLIEINDKDNLLDKVSFDKNKYVILATNKNATIDSNVKLKNSLERI